MSARTGDDAPSVSAVVATRDREELLRQTVEAILGQHYHGSIEVLIVYDQADPDFSHERRSDGREVRVLTNTHRPGLAGARNSGIDAARGELVAFCDDDDVWRPEKLARQVERLVGTASHACVTGIAVHYEGQTLERIPDPLRITPDLLHSSRLTGAHPSSYLMTRDLCAAVGPVDEELPGGYGEDFDWLLRLAAHSPVEVVREPLVDVLWHQGSFFSSRWRSMVDSVDYLVEKYPELAADRPGLARLRGQQAFAHAAQKERREALRTSGTAWRLNPREPRAYVAALVAAGVVSASRVMHEANRRGRGI
jgi:glycosyltransferase involved in cell wall biosynthesis